MFLSATVCARNTSWIRGAAHLLSSHHEWRLKTVSSRVELNSRTEGGGVMSPPQGLNPETKSPARVGPQIRQGTRPYHPALNAASGAR